MTDNLQLVYMTGRNKQVTMEEAKQIIEMIRIKAVENTGWIEIVKDEEWSIGIVDKEANALSSMFRFYTEFDRDPTEAAAMRLAGEKEPKDRLTFGGRLDACSCDITNEKFKILVERILDEMNKITHNKFDAHWV